MSKSTKNSDIQSSRKSHRINQVKAHSQATSLKNRQFSVQSNHQKRRDVYIEDIYERAQSAKEMIKKNTGLVYDLRMVNHKNIWDPSHEECPERFSRILQRCEELGLVDRCQQVPVRPATHAELLTVHSQAHIDQLLATHGCQDLDHMELLASKYDAIYIHPETYELALLSAGCTIQLVHEVATGSVQNGMAIVRPPGHHAMQTEFCGYCFFNNIAVAARHALDQLGIQRILIVDWDVHHGQATQQMFYDDPRVVYFSIHRYEYGEFWPNLKESDFNYVGEGRGAGFNFNIPLNKTELGDAEYMAIFHQVLLPIAVEFQPELILISAGYDAAVGCPEGEMLVTPACYAHLVSSLMALAAGRVAVILEGGYCFKSLAEAAALTLRALLGEPCPNLPPLSAPSKSIQECVLNCIYSHKKYWRCFQFQGSYSITERNTEVEKQHWPEVRFSFNGPKLETFPTRNCCPVQTVDVKTIFDEKLDLLISETKLIKPQHKVCLVYDSLMMEHRNLNDSEHPERPSRIQKIFERHLEYNILDRLLMLQSRIATREELLMVHEESYLEELEALCVATEQMMDDVKHTHYILEKKNSVYIHPKTIKSASLASGSLLQVVDSVMQGDSKAGVAVIRPPGHHAETNQACGFCIFNNVSIAAKYAIKKYSLQRVLILDWDVHHGNGTQRVFLSDPQVLYISVHRYDHGTFFPCSEDAAPSVVGTGAGVGFNVNIPWNQKGMGNAEYVAAFLQVVLPVAYQFSPELVLISAGFDAAVGDPLGGCKVAPETYALLTSWIAPLSMGRVILCLEGGYNLSSISYAMTLCTKALLGDPAPPVDLAPLKSSAVHDLKTVLSIQKKHWPVICFNKDLPKEDVLTSVSEANDKSSDTNELIDKFLHMEIKSDTATNEVCCTVTNDGTFMKISDRSISGGEIVLSNISPAAEVGHVKQVPSQGNGQTPTTGSAPASDPGEAGPSCSSSNEDKTQKPKTTLDAILKEMGMDEGFAVHPSHDCPHLPAVAPLPASGIDINSPCLECSPDSCASVENWICLTCFTVHCGRVVKEHMVLHSLDSSHPIVLGFLDLSVWCYSCDSYIESPVLYEAKNAAHVNKFGHSMPNIYNIELH